MPFFTAFDVFSSCTRYIVLRYRMVYANFCDSNGMGAKFGKYLK